MASPNVEYENGRLPVRRFVVNLCADASYPPHYCIEFNTERHMPNGSIVISQTATDVHIPMSVCRTSPL